MERVQQTGEARLGNWTKLSSPWSFIMQVSPCIRLKAWFAWIRDVTSEKALSYYSFRIHGVVLGSDPGFGQRILTKSDFFFRALHDDLEKTWQTFNYIFFYLSVGLAVEEQFLMQSKRENGGLTKPLELTEMWPCSFSGDMNHILIFLATLCNVHLECSSASTRWIWKQMRQTQHRTQW